MAVNWWLYGVVGMDDMGGNRRVGSQETSAVPQCIDSRVRWVVEWLRRADLSRVCHIEELAASVRLSPSRFRHLFHNQVGVTPNQFLKELRLARARQLLAGSFLEVKEIATAAGFGDVSHFVRDYKAFYGETPSQTRFNATAPGRREAG